jgi:hypothetical protein
MNRMSARLPTTLGAAVALALTLGACGPEEDTSGRRPLGQQQATPMQGGLPEGHPEVPGMGNGGTASGEPVGRDLPRAVTMHLDSGNAAYRAGDYGAARSQYQAAVGEDSTAAAAWFGVYMAERALNNELAADSALRRAGDLGGASEVHGSPSPEEGGDEEAGEMPHPPMETPDR